MTGVRRRQPGTPPNALDGLTAAVLMAVVRGARTTRSTALAAGTVPSVAHERLRELDGLGLVGYPHDHQGAVHSRCRLLEL